jgi:hypothetical protein
VVVVCLASQSSLVVAVVVTSVNALFTSSLVSSVVLIGSSLFSVVLYIRNQAIRIVQGLALGELELVQSSC